MSFSGIFHAKRNARCIPETNGRDSFLHRDLLYSWQQKFWQIARWEPRHGRAGGGHVLSTLYSHSLPVCGKRHIRLCALHKLRSMLVSPSLRYDLRLDGLQGSLSPAREVISNTKFLGCFELEADKSKFKAQDVVLLLLLLPVDARLILDPDLELVLLGWTSSEMGEPCASK